MKELKVGQLKTALFQWKDFDFFLSEGKVCFVGLGSDPKSENRRRWMISVAAPCQCAEVRLGGIYIPSPARPFKVKYFDTFLLSSDPDEIKQWLNCPGK